MAERPKEEEPELFGDGAAPDGDQAPTGRQGKAGEMPSLVARSTIVTTVKTESRKGQGPVDSVLPRTRRGCES